MTVAREEIFGPVLCIIGYKDVDDAVSIANDTVYGLAAYVQSASEERAGQIGPARYINQRVKLYAKEQILSWLRYLPRVTIARRQQLDSLQGLRKSLISNKLPRMDSNHDKVIQSFFYKFNAVFHEGSDSCIPPKISNLYLSKNCSIFDSNPARP